MRADERLCSSKTAITKNIWFQRKAKRFDETKLNASLHFKFFSAVLESFNVHGQRQIYIYILDGGILIDPLQIWPSQNVNLFFITYLGRNPSTRKLLLTRNVTSERQNFINMTLILSSHTLSCTLPLSLSYVSSPLLSYQLCKLEIPHSCWFCLEYRSAISPFLIYHPYATHTIPTNHQTHLSLPK